MLKEKSLNTKLVALTFDDEPCGCTEKLLDALKERGIKATFFMIGKNAEQYPLIVKRAIDEGHDIGCHTYSHCDWRQASHETVIEEMDKFEEQIHKVAPDYTVKWLRGPGGGFNEYVLKECVARNWCIFGWSNSLDEKLTTAEAIATSSYNKETGEYDTFRDGDFVLIHPRNELMVEASICLADRLISDGCKLVTLTELMQRHNGGIPGHIYRDPIY